jgi:hypothetical protein
MEIPPRRSHAAGLYGAQFTAGRAAANPMIRQVNQVICPAVDRTAPVLGPRRVTRTPTFMSAHQE